MGLFTVTPTRLLVALNRRLKKRLLADTVGRTGLTTAAAAESDFD